MPQSHLTALPWFSALRNSLREPYSKQRFISDLLAGITVGIVGIPLSMALAVAVGLPPQYGLYTAVVAGLLIPLFGGARFSVSGPTAAFVVILQPVVVTYGAGGLWLATLVAGLILLAMAAFRLGRLIQYIPEPVTLGFTAGIAVVIAVLQVKDFFGLPLGGLPASMDSKLWLLASHLTATHWPTLLTGSCTLLVLIVWSRLRTPVPGHLPAVLIGTTLALVLSNYGYPVATLNSEFSFQFPDGSQGLGIPPFLPELSWPWQWQMPGGERLLTWSNVQNLMPAAFSIAALGAIESLLCAVVLDNMSNTRHQSNTELLGQGVGNVVAPLFGGFAATAALARSAVNYRAGATSPFAAIIHALMILLAIVLLARWLGYLPMASLAALLLMVAWNMSELPRVRRLLKQAPRTDIAVFIVCFGLTVMFDMVIAISVGVVMASLLFMHQIANMTVVSNITASHPQLTKSPLPERWQAYKITGPLFFAAAEKVFAELEQEIRPGQGMLLYWDNVPLLDAGGLSAFEHFVEAARRKGAEVHVTDIRFQPLRTLAKAGVQSEPGLLTFSASLEEAVAQLQTA